MQSGVTRENAYAWVQECALAAIDGDNDFLALLLSHEEISKKLSVTQIKKLASLRYQLRHVSEIYKQVHLCRFW